MGWRGRRRGEGRAWGTFSGLERGASHEAERRRCFKDGGEVRSIEAAETVRRMR